MSLLASVDLNWVLQFIVTVFIVAVGLLHLVKNAASKYFLAEEEEENNGHRENDDVSDWSSSTSTIENSTKNRNTMTRGGVAEEEACAVCGNLTKKQCSQCKIVKYCSTTCQRSHWDSGHKKKCKDLQLAGKSTMGGRKFSGAASGGSSHNQPKKILFPYEEFLELFNWDKPGFPPCGLLNCGNSCFANVVLQCLAYTKPLVAFLLEKGHRRECKRNDWCFLCEFQTHVERARQNLNPFSPINILSRLPNIGGNLGYGKQEDAHEFMRFAIDTMQSVCLDEFGGEKAVHPTSQETTLIQHIFGGHLQSQVICTKCNNISNQFENMMDLTVEIHGDAASLEECLDQFTAKEWLHGDNMYKCDGCNDYVMAWKRLTIRRAPNILTIALKRFQSGRFGKLNKRVTFPETLDLSPYMSEEGEDSNVYKLYAVIVHVDMLNASFFGHYICYIKDFRGKWYRIDDCKVLSIDLDEVLSQGAYMLLYSRISARPSSLYPVDPSKKDEQENLEVVKEVLPSSIPQVQFNFSELSNDTHIGSNLLPSDDILEPKVTNHEEVQLFKNNSEYMEEVSEMDAVKENLPVSMDVEICEEGGPVSDDKAADPIRHTHRLVIGNDSLTRMNSNEADSLKIESPSSSLIDDVTRCDAGIATENFSRRSLDEGPAATHNHYNEKEEKLVGVSPAASSSSNKMKSASYMPSSTIVQVARGKSKGRHSKAALKPIFSRGFLDKQLQNKCIKGDGEVSVELGQQVSSVKFNCQINGVAKPHLSCQNGGSVRNVDKDQTGYYNDRPAANILDNQAGVLEEGSQINESGECISCVNVDSRHPILANESTTVTMTDDNMLATEGTLVFEDMG